MMSSEGQRNSKEIVSGAVIFGGSTQLYKLNHAEPLENICMDLCRSFGVAYETGKFGLRDDTSGLYVGGRNGLLQVRDGFLLRLDSSPQHTVTILSRKMDPRTGDEEKTEALAQLSVLCKDPVFVGCFVAEGGFSRLQDMLLPDVLSFRRLDLGLRTLLHLFHLGVVESLLEPIVRRCMKLVVSEHSMDPDLISSSLAILREIVTSKSNRMEARSHVENHMGLEHILHHLWNVDNPNIQVKVLALINALANGSSCMKILASMSTKNTRETIHRNIVENEVSKAMSHELQVYQLHVLNLEMEKMNHRETTVGGLSHRIRDINAIVSRAEKDHKRCSTSSVPSSGTPNPGLLQELKECYDTPRLKRSVSTPDNTTLIPSSGEISLKLSRSDQLGSVTLELMYYFARTYTRTYLQVMLEEKVLFRSFPAMCEQIARLLFQVLGLGQTSRKDTPSPYQPLVFSLNSVLMFLEELFCRTILLLGRTRRDMRVRTVEDQEKVLCVLRRQLKEVLLTRPLTLEELSLRLRSFPYSWVKAAWQREQEEQDRRNMDTSPPIQALKRAFTPDILQLIREQRLGFLRGGTAFPKYNSRGQREKKKWWFVQLSPNHQMLHYGESNDKGTYLDGYHSIYLSSVKSVLIGRKCPHIKEIRSRKGEQDIAELAFSLTMDAEPPTLDFVAPDQATFNCWVDGIHILRGQAMRSPAMTEDLQRLLDMEVRLHLLDMEGIPIPSKPPHVPKEPPNYDFCVMHY